MVKQNSNYEDKIKKIREFIRGRWEDVRPYAMGYPPHGPTHCEKIEEKLNQLLPEERFKKLSEEKRFLLFASIWLHDIGMHPELRDVFPEDPPASAGNEFLRKWEKEILRPTHARRSAIFIKRKASDLGLNQRESDLLATICENHRKSSNLDKVKLDDCYRLLIAYLRLADALQIPERAPAGEVKRNIQYGMDAKSKFHWFKSIYTSDIRVILDEKIVIKLRTPAEWKGNIKEDIKPLIGVSKFQEA